MKKIFLVGVAVGLMSWLGCGGDDPPNGPVEPTIITVTAATSATAPERILADDQFWAGIDPKNVPMVASQFSSANKRRPSSALAVADGVGVKAMVVGGTDLYLRLTWVDAISDRWPGQWEVTSFDTLPPDTLAHFTQDNLSSREDQAMVMFKGDSDLGWDVWHWRMTTTGAGYLAEGAVLNGSVLTVDAGDEIADSNKHEGGWPLYMHPEGPNNQHWWLYADNTAAMVFDSAWSMGDLVPGWTIDGGLYLETPDTRGDRWDVGAFSRFSSEEYTLVLHRALNTGHETDLDLSGTIDVRIGITNNGDFSFTSGGTQQGFSNTFRLVLPE